MTPMSEPPRPPAGQRPATWCPGLPLQAALLVGITLALFSSSLRSGFVYDARLQILSDTFIHDPHNWWNVLSFRVLGMDVLDFNRPVHLASLMLDSTFWGTDPFGYHLTSILLHAAVTVLVWLVARGVLAARPGGEPLWSGLAAFLAALLFAVEPVVTEAVCEPTYREDLLAALFSLGALALAIYREPGRRGSDLWRGTACALACLLAVGSKESGIAAPFFLATYWALFRRGERDRFWAIAIGGGIVLSGLFLAARFLLEPSPSVIFETKPHYPAETFAATMLIQPRIFALYLQDLIWPPALCADYGLYSVRFLPLWLSLVLLVLFVAGMGWAAWRDRRVLPGLAVMLLPLLPVSNLIPIYRAAADRYLYLPLAGAALVLACLLDSPWMRSHRGAREFAALACLAAAMALGAANMGRQAVWADPVALWRDTSEKNPISFTAISGLGEALGDTGQYGEAEKMLKAAIRLPDGKRGDTFASLAIVLDALGRGQEAGETLDKALELEPRLADPDRRCQVLAIDRTTADAVKRLLWEYRSP